MLIGISGVRAPLANCDSPHMVQIQYNRLKKSLSERGIEIDEANCGEQSIRVNLRGLIPAQGSVHAAQVAVVETLRELGADAVSLEPQDLQYLYAPDNVLMFATGRGLQSNVAGLTDLLHDIPAGEDGDVPLFDRIHQACEFVVGDRAPEGADEDVLRRGAERDLFNNGFLPSMPDEHYRDWMEPTPEVVPELPEEFRTSPLPYKSLFDTDNY